MKIFGERLKDLRKDKGLSQPVLAKEIGASKGMISLWENNISEPTFTFIVRIARYFGVTANYLLGLED